jgi:hypothetical protein
LSRLGFARKPLGAARSPGGPFKPIARGFSSFFESLLATAAVVNADAMGTLAHLDITGEHLAPHLPVTVHTPDAAGITHHIKEAAPADNVRIQAVEDANTITSSTDIPVAAESDLTPDTVLETPTLQQEQTPAAVCDPVVDEVIECVSVTGNTPIEETEDTMTVAENEVAVTPVENILENNTSVAEQSFASLIDVLEAAFDDAALIPAAQNEFHEEDAALNPAAESVINETPLADEDTPLTDDETPLADAVVPTPIDITEVVSDDEVLTPAAQNEVHDELVALTPAADSVINDTPLADEVVATPIGITEVVTDDEVLTPAVQDECVEEEVAPFTPEQTVTEDTSIVVDDIVVSSIEVNDDAASDVASDDTLSTPVVHKDDDTSSHQVVEELLDDEDVESNSEQDIADILEYTDLSELEAILNEDIKGTVLDNEGMSEIDVKDLVEDDESNSEQDLEDILEYTDLSELEAVLDEDIKGTVLYNEGMSEIDLQDLVDSKLAEDDELLIPELPLIFEDDFDAPISSILDTNFERHLDIDITWSVPQIIDKVQLQREMLRERLANFTLQNLFLAKFARNLSIGGTAPVQVAAKVAAPATVLVSKKETKPAVNTESGHDQSAATIRTHARNPSGSSKQSHDTAGELFDCPPCPGTPVTDYSPVTPTKPEVLTPVPDQAEVRHDEAKDVGPEEMEEVGHIHPNDETDITVNKNNDVPYVMDDGEVLWATVAGENGPTT